MTVCQSNLIDTEIEQDLRNDLAHIAARENLSLDQLLDLIRENMPLGVKHKHALQVFVLEYNS